MSRPKYTPKKGSPAQAQPAAASAKSYDPEAARARMQEDLDRQKRNRANEDVLASQRARAAEEALKQERYKYYQDRRNYKDLPSLAERNRLTPKAGEQEEFRLLAKMDMLRKQFPELTEAELRELAMSQLGMVHSPGRAQSKPVPAQGTPYGQDNLMSVKAWDSKDNPMHGQAPPQPKAGHTVHSIGGSKIAFPGWMAGEAEHQRWAERQKREIELRMAQQQAEAMESGNQIRLQEQQMEIQRMRDEMEYDRYMRAMKMRDQGAPVLGGLMQSAPQRKPVSYLGD